MSPTGDTGAESFEQAGAPAAAEGAAFVQDAMGADASATASSEQIQPADAEGAEGVAAAADDTTTVPDAWRDLEKHLEKYPEAIRQQFKDLPPELRKGFYEYAEEYVQPKLKAQAADEIKVAQDRAAALQREKDARDAQVQKILDSQGAYVGQNPVKMADFGLTEDAGFPTEGPTYDDLVRLMGTRNGRSELANKYGLDETNSEFLRAQLERGQQMLDSSAQLLEDAAWGQLAANVKTALEAVPGIDPESIVAGTNGPQQWLPRLIGQLDERHNREMTALKRDYDARIGAHTANAEGMRGRVVAAESRRLPAGGRSVGSPTELTLDRYNAMSADERRQLSSSERDAMMARHMAAKKRTG